MSKHRYHKTAARSAASRANQRKATDAARHKPRTARQLAASRSNILRAQAHNRGHHGHSVKQRAASLRNLAKARAAERHRRGCPGSRRT